MRSNNLGYSYGNSLVDYTTTTPTTREYVYLVTRGYFRSRDEDGGHVIRSAIAENRMLCAKKITAASVIEAELLPIEVLHCGNRDLCLFHP